MRVAGLRWQVPGGGLRVSTDSLFPVPYSLFPIPYPSIHGHLRDCGLTIGQEVEEGSLPGA